MEKVPFRTAPMRTTLTDKPLDRANWVFEENYDGMHILVYKEGPEVSLLSRTQVCGKGGSGITEESLGSLYRKTEKIIRTKSPISEEVRERPATFVAPRLVAQVAFTEWTQDGKLRHPVYLGLRDDGSMMAE